MKDLLKDLLHFLDRHPILTSIILFALSIYLIVYVLPKVYKQGKEKTLYSYSNELAITVVSIFFSVLFLIIQLFRVFGDSTD